MKPLGLTPGLRVIRPTTAEDAIWDAVEKAIEEEMTPERFLSEVSECWQEKLRDEAKHVGKVFRR